MRSTGLILLASFAVSACDSPPMQTEPSNIVNATRTDQAFPSSADGNAIVSGTAAAPTGAQQGQGTPPQ